MTVARNLLLLVLGIALLQVSIWVPIVRWMRKRSAAAQAAAASTSPSTRS